MAKDLRVMDDPVLDRIFSEAYRDTLRQVDTLENQKTLKDRYEALAELFERDLYGRDLSHQERQEFVQIFKEYISDAEVRVQERKERRRRLIGITSGSAVLALILAASILAVIYRPFASQPKITQELDTLLVKVDEGYGEYSKTYYRTLKTYRLKLGPELVAQYEQAMHAELEEGFLQNLEGVENGRIALYDDAREWANYFPDREERKALKQEAQNALVAGLGGAMGEAAESVIEGMRGLMEKGADALRERAAEIRDAGEDETEEDTPAAPDEQSPEGEGSF